MCFDLKCMLLLSVKYSVGDSERRDNKPTKFKIHIIQSLYTNFFFVKLHKYTKNMQSFYREKVQLDNDPYLSPVYIIDLKCSLKIRTACIKWIINKAMIIMIKVYFFWVQRTLTPLQIAYFTGDYFLKHTHTIHMYALT